MKRKTQNAPTRQAIAEANHLRILLSDRVYQVGFLQDSLAAQEQESAKSRERADRLERELADSRRLIADQAQIIMQGVKIVAAPSAESPKSRPQTPAPEQPDTGKITHLRPSWYAVHRTLPKHKTPTRPEALLKILQTCDTPQETIRQTIKAMCKDAIVFAEPAGHLWRAFAMSQDGGQTLKICKMGSSANSALFNVFLAVYDQYHPANAHELTPTLSAILDSLDKLGIDTREARSAKRTRKPTTQATQEALAKAAEALKAIEALGIDTSQTRRALKQ